MSKTNRWRKAWVHNDLVGCKISEYHKNIAGSKYTYLRFVATIRGWRNWKIAEGPANEISYDDVLQKVAFIRDRIDNGDETVFRS